MPTIKELFKSRQKELYGKSENVRINSLGLINPPRGAALLVSSPNALADLIGNQIGGALGGSANRPSDTIFRNDTFLAKPISLFKTKEGLKNAVEAETEYFVKKSPAPASIFSKLKQGATNPAGLLKQAAVSAINNIGGSKKGLNTLKDDLKARSQEKNSEYGAKYQEDRFGKKIDKTKTFYATNGGKSVPHYPVYDRITNKYTGREEYVQIKLKERDETSNNWDDLNELIMNSNISSTPIDSKTETKLIESSTSYIKIHVLGEPKAMFFNATISGLNETVSPEIQDYKFLGSPFKVYTYGGVERNLTFDFKLYYYDRASKQSLVEKLEYLTKLAYPFRELVQTKYSNSISLDSGQVMFAPNFIRLSIKSLYSDILGIVDTLSFSVDDTTAWTTSTTADGAIELLPNVINVQFGMKIIESINNYNITDIKGKKVFGYNFRTLDDQSVVNDTLSEKTKPTPKDKLQEVEDLAEITVSGGKVGLK
jgi:hypothetical protein